MKKKINKQTIVRIGALCLAVLILVSSVIAI